MLVLPRAKVVQPWKWRLGPRFWMVTRLSIFIGLVTPVSVIRHAERLAAASLIAVRTRTTTLANASAKPPAGAKWACSNVLTRGAVVARKRPVWSVVTGLTVCHLPMAVPSTTDLLRITTVAPLIAQEFLRSSPNAVMVRPIVIVRAVTLSESCVALVG